MAVTEMNPFEQRLAALEARYNELGELLSAPDAYQDLDRVQQLSREQAKLREVVEAARRWRDAQDAAREAEEMARAESDPQMVAMAEEEHHTQIGAAEAEYDKLRALLLTADPNDDRDVIVEIRAGTGGDEAALFAADLFRMYLRYAERQRWRIEVLDQSETRRSRLQGDCVRGARAGRVLAAQIRVGCAPRAARAGDRGTGPHPYVSRIGCRAPGSG